MKSVINVENIERIQMKGSGMTNIVIIICLTVAFCWIAYCNRSRVEYHYYNPIVVKDKEIAEKIVEAFERPERTESEENNKP